MKNIKSNVLPFRQKYTNNKPASHLEEFADFRPPNYLNENPDQDQREAAEIRAATEFLGY